MSEKMERIYWKLTVDERIHLLRELAFSNMPRESLDKEIAKIVDTVSPSDASEYNCAALEEMHLRYHWLNYKLVSEMLEKAYSELEQVAERRKKLILQVGCVARMLIQDSNLPAKTKKELMMEWSEDFSSFMYSSIFQSEWFQQVKLTDSEFLSNRVKRLAELERQTSFPPCKPGDALSKDEIRSKLHHTYMLTLEIILNEYYEFCATRVMLYIAGVKEPKDLNDPKEAAEVLQKGRECLKTRFLDNEACKDIESKFQQQVCPRPEDVPDTREIFQARATDYIQSALAKEIEKETEKIS